MSIDLPGYPSVISSHAVHVDAVRGYAGGIGLLPASFNGLHQRRGIGLALRVGFRRSLVVHFHYGLAVLYRLLPTPPHGDAVTGTSPPHTANWADETFTRLLTVFPGSPTPPFSTPFFLFSKTADNSHFCASTGSDFTTSNHFTITIYELVAHFLISEE